MVVFAERREAANMIQECTEVNPSTPEDRHCRCSFVLIYAVPACL